MDKASEDLKQWVENWQRTGQEIEKLRIEEMRKSDVYESMQALTDAFESTMANFDILPTSGLVEQQRWFMLLEKMLPLVETDLKVQNFLESQSWQFCIIGGLALQRWGEARVTKDVDITLLTGYGDETEYTEKLLNEFEPRLENAAEFASRIRVLLLKSNNIGIDIAFGALPFEVEAIERASPFPYTPNISLKTCSAEDLIVMKAFADRTRDWADIETIVQKQNSLDWQYISRQLEPLVELKYAPEILVKLQKVRDVYYQK